MATRLHAKNGNGCSNEVQMRETMRALPVREQTVRRAKREAQAFPETCSQERRKWSWPWQSGTFEWRDQPTISSFLFIKCLGGVLRLPLQCLFPLLCPFIKNQVLKKKVLEKSQLVVEDYKWIHINQNHFQCCGMERQVWVTWKETGFKILKNSFQFNDGHMFFLRSITREHYYRFYVPVDQMEPKQHLIFSQTSTSFD